MKKRIINRCYKLVYLLAIVGVVIGFGVIVTRNIPQPLNNKAMASNDEANDEIMMNQHGSIKETEAKINNHIEQEIETSNIINLDKYNVDTKSEYKQISTESNDLLIALKLARDRRNEIQGKVEEERIKREEEIRRQKDVQQKIEQLKQYLNAQLGKQYVWGGNGPNVFDCSGLVKYVYGKVDINLPRVASDQSKIGNYIKPDELQYGDLIFFSKDGEVVHHVGIYIGNNRFIHAPQTDDVVKIDKLEGYYSQIYKEARRHIE